MHRNKVLYLKMLDFSSEPSNWVMHILLLSRRGPHLGPQQKNEKTCMIETLITSQSKVVISVAVQIS